MMQTKLVMAKYNEIAEHPYKLERDITGVPQESEFERDLKWKKRFDILSGTKLYADKNEVYNKFLSVQQVHSTLSLRQ